MSQYQVPFSKLTLGRSQRPAAYHLEHNPKTNRSRQVPFNDSEDLSWLDLSSWRLHHQQSNQKKEQVTPRAPDESWDGSLAVIEKPFWRYINSASAMVQRALEQCRKAGDCEMIARLNQWLMVG